MTKSITIPISEQDHQQLLRRAQQTGQSPEDLVAAWLASALQPVARDPLIQLSGSIDSGIADLSERQDEFVGQAALGLARGDSDG